MSKFAGGQKWWVFFSTWAFWPRYGVPHTSRGCIFIHHYSHENISKIHENFFYEILAFFQIFLIFTYIFLTKLCTKNDLNKDWTEIYSNESVLLIVWRIRFWKILFIICSNFNHLWKNRFIWTYFWSIFVRVIFCTWFRKENIRKVSKIGKNDKISGKKNFMNSRNIFMWVMVDENTSPGSVLNTISWSESMYCKKPPSFWTPC